jgi:hypothetical protein
MTTLGQLREQTIEEYGQEHSRNSALSRPGPKKGKLTLRVFPNRPNYEIASIYQERRKLQTLGERDERAKEKTAPTSGKRSIGINLNNKGDSVYRNLMG